MQKARALQVVRQDWLSLKVLHNFERFWHNTEKSGKEISLIVSKQGRGECMGVEHRCGEQRLIDFTFEDYVLLNSLYDAQAYMLPFRSRIIIQVSCEDVSVSVYYMWISEMSRKEKKAQLF